MVTLLIRLPNWINVCWHLGFICPFSMQHCIMCQKCHYVLGPSGEGLRACWPCGIRPFRPCSPKTLQKKTQASASRELIPQPLKSCDCPKEKGAVACSVHSAGFGRPPDPLAVMSFLPQLPTRDLERLGRERVVRAFSHLADPEPRT